MKRFSRILTSFLLGLALASPSFAQTPPPADSGTRSDPESPSTRSPRDRQDAVMPEKNLMPKAEPGEDQDLDGPFAFEYLKSLAGEWRPAEGGGHSGDTISYRVTAGGSAIIETAFPGTGRECVSIYLLEGKELMVTHLSSLGNQPRLRFDDRRSYPGKYFFVLTGGSGFDRSKDPHVRETAIEFQGLDRIRVTWQVYRGRTKADATSASFNRLNPVQNAATAGN